MNNYDKFIKWYINTFKSKESNLTLFLNNVKYKKIKKDSSNKWKTVSSNKIKFK